MNKVNSNLIRFLDIAGRQKPFFFSLNIYGAAGQRCGVSF